VDVNWTDLARQLVVVIVPVLTMLILQVVKKGISFIPNWLLPILAPIVGVVIQGLADGFSLATLPEGGALGLTAVGLNQIAVQARKATS
jgi:hypothetical protein